MDLNFIPLTPLWLIIAGFSLTVAAAIFGVLLLFNRPRTRTASLIAFTLRLAALTTLTFYILQPHSELEITRTGDRPVAVLLDVSDSMSLDDGFGEGVTRLERGIGLLAGVEGTIDNAGGETVKFAFADGVIPFNPDINPDEIPDKISRNITDLSEALRSIGNPAAAVVISDGIFDTTADADFPVFFVNPTSGPSPGGCWAYSAAAPSRVLPGSRFPIEVIYRSTSEKAVRFEVFDGDRKITSGTGPSGSGLNRVTLYVNEEEPGQHFYRVAGLPGTSEIFTNTEIVRGPITVSYIAHNVDYDTGYLRRAMASNEAVELTYYPAAGNSREKMSLITPETDVIILANPSIKHLDNARVAEIEDRVAAGAGLLLLFSAASPDVRAVEIGSLRALMPLSGGNPKTPLGGGQPEALTSGAAGSFGSGVIPSFTHLWNFGDPKPASEVIWSLGGAPVLTGMRYGEGRVMLLAGGGFYRWENSRADDNPGMAQLAASLVLYLSESADDGVTLSDNIVDVGGTITISAVSPEEPAFIITGPDNIPNQLSSLEIRPGLWKAEFSPKTIGEYTLTVRRFSGEGLSVDKKRILAVKPFGEKSAGFPNIETMRSTGDGFFTGSEMPLLEKGLKNALLATGPETTEKRNALLLPDWIVIGLFILLLSAEWTVRRLMGLA